MYALIDALRAIAYLTDEANIKFAPLLIAAK
jgi:hypothetical protein